MYFIYFYSLVIRVDIIEIEFQRIARTDFEESTKPFSNVLTIFSSTKFTYLMLKIKI